MTKNRAASRANRARLKARANSPPKPGRHVIWARFFSGTPKPMRLPLARQLISYRSAASPAPSRRGPTGTPHDPEGPGDAGGRLSPSPSRRGPTGTPYDPEGLGDAGGRPSPPPRRDQMASWRPPPPRNPSPPRNSPRRPPRRSPRNSPPEARLLASPPPPETMRPFLAAALSVLSELPPGSRGHELYSRMFAAHAEWVSGMLSQHASQSNKS